MLPDYNPSPEDIWNRVKKNSYIRIYFLKACAIRLKILKRFPTCTIRFVMGRFLQH